MNKLNIVSLKHVALEQADIGAFIAYCSAAAYNACI
jgi:hypothetical protein